MPDWGIVAARFLQYGPALVLFGAPLFCLTGFDQEQRHLALNVAVWPRAAAISCALLGFFGATGWVIAETASIFSDPGQFGPGAIWTVLTGTGFGRSAALRIALLAAAILAPLLIARGSRSLMVQVLLGAAIVASFAWTGHGGEGEGLAGGFHRAADILHLIAAGVWIGALFVLTRMIIHAIGMQAEGTAGPTWHALNAFSRTGTAVVLVLLLSGLINSWFLVGPGHVDLLFTSSWGRLLMLKLTLFAAMLALACLNRWYLNPQFGNALQVGEGGQQQLQRLKRSVATETTLAILVLAVVSWMGTLEPPVSAG